MITRSLCRVVTVLVMEITQGLLIEFPLTYSVVVRNQMLETLMTTITSAVQKTEEAVTPLLAWRSLISTKGQTFMVESKMCDELAASLEQSSANI